MASLHLGAGTLQSEYFFEIGSSALSIEIDDASNGSCSFAVLMTDIDTGVDLRADSVLNFSDVVFEDPVVDPYMPNH